METACWSERTLLEGVLECRPTEFCFREDLYDYHEPMGKFIFVYI